MMSDQRIPAPLQQANGGLPLPLHHHQDQKIDTDKLLFWTVAKKIAKQRRREENSVVMKYQQQHQERKQPIHVPTEICGGGGASTHASASIRLRQQKDAAWLFAPTTTEDDLMVPNDPLSHAKKDSSTGSSGSYHKDDNEDDGDDDDMSCVSDVTRELQDIDAPALYPSLACLEQVLPDIQVSQGQTGKIAVSASKNAHTDNSATLYSLSSSYFLEEEDEGALDILWTVPTTLGGIVTEKINKRYSKDNKDTHKAKKAMEEEYDFSNLMMPNSSVMKKGSNAWKNKDSNCRGRSRREPTVVAASKKGTRHTSETSPKPPQRRLSLGSQNEEDEKDMMMTLGRGRMSSDNALTRKVSSTSPIPPQRRVSRKYSLDSHFSNSLVDLMTQQMRKNSKSRTSDRINKCIMDLQPSTESPVPPKRRHSMESSHVSGMDFLRCHPQKAAKTTDLEIANNSTRFPTSATWEELSYGGSHCGGNGKEKAPSQAFKDDTPSRQELGYDEEDDEVHDFAAPTNNHASPHLPLRQASFTSFLDDNSTIATETLGLYRRRKSIDSTVAAPLYSNRLPDAPPSPPKRRRSTISTVQGPFPSSSMARFASIERVQPGSLWAVDDLEQTLRLSKIELDKL